MPSPRRRRRWPALGTCALLAAIPTCAAGPAVASAGRILAAFSGGGCAGVATPPSSSPSVAAAWTRADARAVVLAVDDGPKNGLPVCRFMTGDGMEALRTALAGLASTPTAGAPQLLADDQVGDDAAANATAVLAAVADGPTGGRRGRADSAAAAADGLMAEAPARALRAGWYACTRPRRVPPEVSPALVWRPAAASEETAEEGDGAAAPLPPTLVALPSSPAAPFAAWAAPSAAPAGPATGGTLVAVSGPALAALALGGDVACAFGRHGAATALPLRQLNDSSAAAPGPWDAACEAPPWDLRVAAGGLRRASRVTLTLTAPGGCTAAVVVGGEGGGGATTEAATSSDSDEPFAFTFVPDTGPAAIAPTALARGTAAAGTAVSVFLDRRVAPWSKKGGSSSGKGKKQGGEAALPPAPETDADAEAVLASLFPSPAIRLHGAGTGGEDVDVAATWSAGGRALAAVLPRDAPPPLRPGRHAVSVSLDGQAFAGAGAGEAPVTVEVGGPDLRAAPALVLVGAPPAANTTPAVWTAAFELAGPAPLPPSGCAAAVSAALVGWPPAGPGSGRPAPTVTVHPPSLAWRAGGPRRAAVTVSLAGGAGLCPTCAVVVTATPGPGLPSPLPGAPPVEAVIAAGPRRAFRLGARVVDAATLSLARPAGDATAPTASLAVELTGPALPAPVPVRVAYELAPRSGGAAPFFGAAAAAWPGGCVRGFATFTPEQRDAAAATNATLTLDLPPIDWDAVPPAAAATLDVRLLRSWAVRPEGSPVGARGARPPALALSGVRADQCPPGWAAAPPGVPAAAAPNAEDASFDGSGAGGSRPPRAAPPAAAAAAGLAVLSLEASPPAGPPAAVTPVSLSGVDDGSVSTASAASHAGVEVGATVPAGVRAAVLCLAPADPGAGVEVVEGATGAVLPPGSGAAAAGGTGPPPTAAATAALLAAGVDAADGGSAAATAAADERVGGGERAAAAVRTAAGRRRLAAAAPAWCAASGGRAWTLPLAPGQNEYAVVVTPAGAPRAWRPAASPAAAAHQALALGRWGWPRGQKAGGAGGGGGRGASGGGDASTPPPPPPPPTLWLTVVRLAEEGHARLAELAAAALPQAGNGTAPAAAMPDGQAAAHTLLLCSDTDPASRACSPAEPLLLTLPPGADAVRLVPRLAAPGVAGVTLEVGGRVVAGGRGNATAAAGEDSSSSSSSVGVRALGPGQRAHVPIVVTAEDGVTAVSYALALERAGGDGGGDDDPGGAAGEPPARPPASVAATPVLAPPARCARCPAGRAAPGPDARACGLCPPGTAAAGPGAPACVPCPPGTYARGWGSDRCAPCVPGSFAPPPGGARLCTPCPPNTTALAPGAARCGDPARRTIDPDASPALLVSFELVLTGAGLADVPRRAGVDGPPGAVLGRLVAADTAAALACAPGDVSVSPAVVLSRRVLAVNVTAALAAEAAAAAPAVPPSPAPGPGEAPSSAAVAWPRPAAGEAAGDDAAAAAAAAALADLSADAPMARFVADPDGFFGATTRALGAHAAPGAGRPPTVTVASVPRAAAARRRRLAAGLGGGAALVVVGGCAAWAGVAAVRARRVRRSRATAVGEAPRTPPSPPRSPRPPSSGSGPARRLLVGPASDE